MCYALKKFLFLVSFISHLVVFIIHVSVQYIYIPYHINRLGVNTLFASRCVPPEYVKSFPDHITGLPNIGGIKMWAHDLFFLFSFGKKI